MVENCQVQISRITSIIVRSVIGSKFIGSDIESISSRDGYFLIFGSMVDRILADKLQRPIGLISFEHSNSTFRKRQTETISFIIDQLYSISSFNILFNETTRVNRHQIIFPDSYFIDFRDKLDLLL